VGFYRWHNIQHSVLILRWYFLRIGTLFFFFVVVDKERGAARDRKRKWVAESQLFGSVIISSENKKSD
jgi:hypothetical protein